MYTKKCSITSKRVHCCMHVSRDFFFFGGGLRSCPLLYVRASCDSRDPVSYTISAYLASYCLLRRQQLRFNQPTLESTSVLLVGCVQKNAASPASVYTAVYMRRQFFFFVIGILPFIVRAYLVCVARIHENMNLRINF